MGVVGNLNNAPYLGRRLPVGGGMSLLAIATAYLGGVVPYHYWDFTNDRALFAQADVGSLANTPGWSFTRASTGYAQDSAGNLISFGSGVLRRTDKGVLIEGARTNLCLRSQEFDNASWSVTRASITANVTAAPDGSTTADKLVEDATASNTHRLQQSITVVTATAYTWSVFVKAAERTFCTLQFTDGTNTGFAYFNLSTGAVGSTSGVTATSAMQLANGWWRLSLTMTTAGTAGIGQVFLADSNSTNSYTGNGASGIFVWGAQLEQAAFPSSYTPTTSASATRAADVLTVSTPGTNYPLGLYAEFERAVDTGNFENTFGVDDGSSNNRTLMFLDTTDRVAASARTATVEQLNIPVTGAVAIGAATKSAIRMDTNNAIAVRGGTLSALDNTVTLPANPTRVLFAPSQELFGYLRRAAIFNFAPSDAQLQAMTA